MFSSNPFPEHPSSTNGVSPPNSFFHYNSSIISGDFIIHPYNSSAPPPPALDREEQQYAEDHSDLLDSVVTPYKKTLTTLKKDGHSKIHTAQGPRDRRVRLSIDISRKFFCLQDLLGFDKASETLDWLFSKSLDAIKELVQETSCASSTLSDQSKVTFLESINGLSVEEKAQKKKCVDGKKKKMMPRCKAGSQDNLARAEARARARERTRQKLCIKNLDDELNTLLVPDDLKTFIPYSCESGLWGSGSRNFKAI